MKIRISGNSLRFRLKQTEVKRFRNEGEIREEILFGMLPADQLAFVLKACQSDYFTIFWELNTVSVEVPETVWTEWTNKSTGRKRFRMP
jgi:hypothetical protein